MGRVEQDLTQLAVIMLCNNSAGCDDMEVFIATATSTMVDIVCKVDLIS